VHPQLFAFFVDPAGQPRPGGDQRLVGEVDGALVEGDQPRAGQPVRFWAYTIWMLLLGCLLLLLAALPHAH